MLQVFLEPLAQVVGSTRSKTLLLEACTAQFSTSTLGAVGSGEEKSMALVRLGCLLGIQEWIKPLTNCFEFPKETVKTIQRQPSYMKDELLGDDEEEEMEVQKKIIKHKINE